MFEAEVRLLYWNESSNGGRTIKLELPPSTGEVHPFYGLPTGPKNGQRFRIRFEPIADDETISQDPAPLPESRPLDADTGSGAPAGAHILCAPECSFNDMCRSGDCLKRRYTKDPARSRAGKARYAESDDMRRAVARAAMLIKDDPRFRSWVVAGDDWIGPVSVTAADGALKLRCGIGSKRELASNPVAYEKFRKIETEFALYAGRLPEIR